MSDITGRVERYLTASFPVMANGSLLAERARAEGMNGRPVATLFSSTVPQALIDCGPLHAGLRRKLRILYVGRMSAEKGLDNLIRAVRVYRDRYPEDDLSLTIVGWSSLDEEEKLRRLASALHIGGNIAFVGERRFGEDLFQYYRSSNVFVLPSETEGTPRVLVEAMAFGLVLVATKVGGVPDIVRHGVDGLLVEPGHPSEMADAIRAAWQMIQTDPLCASRMRARAQSFTLERMIDQQLDFLSFARRPGGSEMLG